jgi:putative hemolysin
MVPCGKRKTCGQMAVLIGLLISLCFLCNPVAALMNPAAVYCGALGYQYETKTTPEGVTGSCVFDGEEVEAWQFLMGTAGSQYSYCTKHGLPQKTVTGREACAGIFSSRCAVCTLPDGRDVEVTRLMNLSFAEPDLKIEKHGGEKTGTLPADLNLMIIIAAGILVVIAAGLVFVWKKRKG